MQEHYRAQCAYKYFALKELLSVFILFDFCGVVTRRLTKIQSLSWPDRRRRVPCCQMHRQQLVFHDPPPNFFLVVHEWLTGNVHHHSVNSPAGEGERWGIVRRDRRRTVATDAQPLAH